MYRYRLPLIVTTRLPSLTRFFRLMEVLERVDRLRVVRLRGLLGDRVLLRVRDRVRVLLRVRVVDRDRAGKERSPVLHLDLPSPHRFHTLFPLAFRRTAHMWPSPPLRSLPTASLLAETGFSARLAGEILGSEDRSDRDLACSCTAFEGRHVSWLTVAIAREKIVTTQFQKNAGRAPLRPMARVLTRPAPSEMSGRASPLARRSERRTRMRVRVRTRQRP